MIEKICAEIERQMKLTESGVTIGVLSDILEFIKSLRKEPIRQYISPEDSTLGKLLKEMKDFSPQEDLGISNEEYNDFVNELIFGKEEPISKDLEEVANDYAHDLVHDDVFETFIAGAQWQKEQMLDNALESYIGKFEHMGGHNCLLLEIPMLSKPDAYKYGEKIKVIIVKEE